MFSNRVFSNTVFGLCFFFWLLKSKKMCMKKRRMGEGGVTPSSVEAIFVGFVSEYCPGYEPWKRFEVICTA